MKDKSITGVIWITGYSGAGKSTVAKIVHKKLDEIGVSNVLLDGDLLRSVLGDGFGYSKSDRKSLSAIYGRLSRYISESGTVVVIATVAMFDEIRELNRKSISNYFEVYLKVPISIRKQRDAKGIYTSPTASLDSSTEPKAADIVVSNFGDVSPQVAAEQVVTSFIEKFSDKNQCENEYIGESQVDYWNQYYKTAAAPVHPSTFAIFCQENYLKNGGSILEFGCGNGRDSFWLAQSNLVLAIDRSLEVITANIKRRNFEGIENLDFERVDFGVDMWRPPHYFDAVYARFVLHSMTNDIAKQAITRSHEVLNEGGLLLLEFRTTKDSLMQRGKKLSLDERITDHYRRFIDFDEAKNSISDAGFRVEYSIESKGLAIHGDEDPVVARIVARRQI